MTTDKTEEVPTIEPVQCVPFDSMLSKGEMVDHLRNAHGIHSIAGTHVHEKMKMTKDDLVRVHRQHHEAQAELEATGRTERYRDVQQPDGSWKKEPQLRIRRFHAMLNPIVIPHEHGVQNTDAARADQEAVDAAKSGKTLPKMTSSELTRLGKLVDNDFANLRSEMQQFAADTKNSRAEDLRAEFAKTKDKSVEYQAKANKLIDKAEAELKELVAKAKDEDISLIVPSFRETRYGDRYAVTAENKARDKAMRTLIDEVDTQLNRALMSLEQQRLTAQRRILMAGISETAKQFLDEIPSAQELMVKSQAENIAKVSITS